MLCWQKNGRQWISQLLRFLLILLLIHVGTIMHPPLVFADTSAAAASTTRSESEPSLLGQSLDADDISPEKISQFIHAYLQVLQLIEQRETELQGAELEPESQQIQREIEGQALDLIQASGLSLQEYLQLLSLTNIDPEFGERVAAQLQEATY